MFLPQNTDQSNHRYFKSSGPIRLILIYKSAYQLVFNMFVFKFLQRLSYNLVYHWECLVFTHMFISTWRLLLTPSSIIIFSHILAFFIYVRFLNSKRHGINSLFRTKCLSKFLSNKSVVMTLGRESQLEIVLVGTVLWLVVYNSFMFLFVKAGCGFCHTVVQNHNPKTPNPKPCVSSSTISLCL